MYFVFVINFLINFLAEALRLAVQKSALIEAWFCVEYDNDTLGGAVLIAF
jgi:hypothetical protein